MNGSMHALAFPPRALPPSLMNDASCQKAYQSKSLDEEYQFGSVTCVDCRVVFMTYIKEHFYVLESKGFLIFESNRAASRII